MKSRIIEFKLMPKFIHLAHGRVRDETQICLISKAEFLAIEFCCLLMILISIRVSFLNSKFF